MNRKRVSIFTLIAVLILMVGIFLGFLTNSIFGNGERPIILPSAGNLTSPSPGDVYDSPAATPVPMQIVSVNSETVQSVIATLIRPESYSCSLNLELFWDGGQSKLLRNVWVRDGYVRVDFYNAGGKLNKSAIIGGDKAFYWTSNSAQFYKGASGNETADDLQSIPTYEDILDIDKKDIASAEYVTLNNEPCILTNVKDEDLGYLDKYWVSVKSGLLVVFERYEGDFLIYRVSMDSMSAVKPEDEWFALPNHELAWDVD